MGIVSWILVGLVVGLFGKIVFGAGKLILGLIFGILGAGLGGFVGTLFGLGAIAVFGFPCLLTALVGACVFMGIGRLMRGVFVR